MVAEPGPDMRIRALTSGSTVAVNGGGVARTRPWSTAGQGCRSSQVKVHPALGRLGLAAPPIPPPITTARSVTAHPSPQRLVSLEPFVLPRAAAHPTLRLDRSSLRSLPSVLTANPITKCD
jgi:hypothetical protein